MDSQCTGRMGECLKLLVVLLLLLVVLLLLLLVVVLLVVLARAPRLVSSYLISPHPLHPISSPHSTHPLHISAPVVSPWGTVSRVVPAPTAWTPAAGRKRKSLTWTGRRKQLLAYFHLPRSPSSLRRALFSS